MMNTILWKLIQGNPVTDEDVISALYDICEIVHSGCDSDCPVYRLNGNAVPLETTGRGKNRHTECSCFKQGSKMLAFIRKKQADGMISERFMS